MSAMTIEPLRPGDEEAALVADSMLRESYSAGRRWVPWRAPETLVARLRDPKPRRSSVFLLAWLDGVVAGAAEATVDPGEPASVEIGVLPSWRRRGLGTALAERVRAGLTGQASIVQSEVYASDGVAFARRQGLRVCNTEHRLVLSRAAMLERRDDAPGASFDVDITSWAGPCPEAVIADWADLRREMHEDVPLGDMTRGSAPTVASFRHNEKRLMAAGYRPIRSLARRDGDPVGYTEMLLPMHDRSIVLQEDTLVRRSHRGQGIARRLKSANLSHLAGLGEFDEVQAVQTYTATSNAPMLSLNASLGFEIVDTMTDMEGPLHPAG